MDDSELYHVRFLRTSFGRYRANIYNEDNWLIDIIQGTSIEDVEETVRNEYPGLKWREPKKWI